jgi:uncharacterized OsmC-like protein
LVLGYSGGELLFLAIGAYYCNDIYREAAKRNIKVKSIHIDVEGDWSGEPLRAQNSPFTAKVEEEAREKEIRGLITYTGQVSEVHNSLRICTPVTLTRIQAISVTK